MPQQDIKQIISDVAQKKEKEEKKQVDSLQVLVYELDQEEYAVRITDVREIITIPDITPIPNAPDFIRGILNLRGQIVVAIDLEKRFGLVREHGITAKHIIVVETEGSNFGIIVDNVTEVLSVPTDHIRPAPDLVSVKIQADYIDGLVVIDGDIDKDKEKNTDARLIVLIDMIKLLQDKELLQIGKTIKQEVTTQPQKEEQEDN